MTRKIYLTGTTGKGKHTIVSHEDFHLVSQTKWNYHPRGYAHGRPPLNGQKKKKVLLHRYIMGVLDDPTVEIDHINHDLLDNRRENLRIVTHAENMENRINRTKSTTSQYRGVNFSKVLGGWVGSSSIKGKSVQFGPFDTELLAAQVVAAYRVSVCKYPYKEDITLGEGIIIPNPLTKELRKQILHTKNQPKREKERVERALAQIEATKKKKEEKAKQQEEILLASQPTTEYKCINYAFKRKKWKVTYGRGEKLLGFFDTEKEAVEAYEARRAEDYKTSTHPMVNHNRLEHKWFYQYGGAGKRRHGPFDTEEEAIKAYETHKKSRSDERKNKFAAIRDQKAQDLERVRFIRGEIQALKCIRNNVRKGYPKTVRAKKQYINNKIRKSAGYSPLPLKYTRKCDR